MENKLEFNLVSQHVKFTGGMSSFSPTNDCFVTKKSTINCLVIATLNFWHMVPRILSGLLFDILLISQILVAQL